MPYTTPPTYTSGQILTAANLNTYLSANENFLYNGSLIPISNTLLGSPAASFDITSIPATWTHLCIVVIGRTDNAVTSQQIGMRFNNDSSAANYALKESRLDGTTYTGADSLPGVSTGIRVGKMTGASSTANYPGVTEIWISGYTGTTFFKGALAKNHGFATSSTNGWLYETGGTWLSTTAINRVTIYPETGNWITGSRCTVYGRGVPT
jgi:hypothetical protein